MRRLILSSLRVHWRCLTSGRDEVQCHEESQGCYLCCWLRWSWVQARGRECWES